MHRERAISIDAKHVGALGNLALIYLIKNYSKAKELHNKVLELQPHHLASLNNMGSIARIEGNRGSRRILSKSNRSKSSSI